MPEISSLLELQDEDNFYHWAARFIRRPIFKKVDIIVIDILLSENEFSVIKEMAKKSKVIMVFSSVYNVEQIKNLVDSDVDRNFFYVKNEKEAIQTVLDCLKEQ